MGLMKETMLEVADLHERAAKRHEKAAELAEPLADFSGAKPSLNDIEMAVAMAEITYELTWELFDITVSLPVGNLVVDAGNAVRSAKKAWKGVDEDDEPVEDPLDACPEKRVESHRNTAHLHWVIAKALRREVYEVARAK